MFKHILEDELIQTHTRHSDSGKSMILVEIWMDLTAKKLTLRKSQFLLMFQL